MAADGHAEDTSGLVDLNHKLIADLSLNLIVESAGDDAVIVDLAGRVDVGLDDDGGVVRGDDGLLVGAGVEIVRGGDGAEGFVFGEHAAGDRCDPNQRGYAAYEQKRTGEARERLEGNGTDEIIPPAVPVYSTGTGPGLLV